MDINGLWSGYDLNSKKQNTRCLSVNTILEGKYLVGSVLGQGGFGITYVGYDLNMETKIAIKEYFPVELVSRDTTTMHGDRVLSLGGEKSVTYRQGLKKYVAEAQNVSQFSEVPGVVSVKDFFYANETAYIVMEFIDGISLKDYLKERGGRLSEEETLKIMKPVLEALVQVHKAGIAHRDISPDNIMLTFEDAADSGVSKNADARSDGSRKIQSVKLIDFGAARMTAKNDQKSLTIILKHGYAPEEQYRTHGEQGPWTDVYAICATMYRMLTGETPVPAMDRLFQDELKTFEQCGTKVSANTSAAILKGLAVKKNDRIQSMQELIGVLYEGAKIRKASSGKGPDHNGKKGLYIGVGAVSAVVLAGVLLMAGGTKESLDPEAVRKAAIESTEIGDPEENSIINPTRETGSGSTEAAEEMVIVDTDVQEDELGEQIVFYHPQDSIDATGTTLFLCKPDGTVEVKGSNASGQFEAKDWTGVVSVKTGYYHTLGLRQDGTVLVTTPAGRDYGQYDVDHWTNIVDIAAGPLLSIGVTADGNVLAAGNGNSDKIDLNHLREWTDIRQIACSHGRFDCIAGLRTDGTVVFEGEFDADIHGWEKVENIFFNYGILVGMEADGTVHVEALADDPEILEWANTMKNLPKMKQIISHTVGITADGTVLLPYLSDTEREVTGWTDMVGISRWNSGFCGIRSDSTIVYDYPNSGNAELEDFTNLEWVRLTDNVNFGSYTGIMGQTKDGTILYCGANNLYMGWIDELGESAEIADVEERMLVLQDGTMYTGGYEDVLPHSNVKEAIYSSDGCILLMQDGTVDAYGLYGGVHQCEEDVKAWTGIQQICGDDEWVCGLKADGTVEMTGDLASDETDIKSIFASKSVCLGIRGDGTVAVLKASNRDEQSGLLQAEQWTDMVQLALSESHIIGLKNDGTVVAAGDNNNGECDIEEWADVVSVDAADGCTIGLTKDGKLLMAGSLY